MKPIRIMFPNFPINKEDITLLKGFISSNRQREVIIYITDYSKHSDLLNAQSYCDNTILGYCSTNVKKLNVPNRNKNFLEVEFGETLQIITLVLNGTKIEAAENCILMLYDYEQMKHSEAMSPTADYFFNLKTLLQNDPRIINEDYEPVLSNPAIFSSSMFIQHFLNYLNLLIWLYKTLKGDKKISIKSGNLIFAILTDIVLGYLALELLTNDKKELGAFLMGILEKLVNLLTSLLKWLMGAPAGLKLNNAFNRMLGKYFSYHIQLWWLFLEVAGEKLDTILNIYQYLGYLGFTFQAAIISDMICIATFHAYCIYVYAARLFNMQTSGLIALLRLFVGRKYNPLRGGIDSCEYTNQELFVGTVAFTILLLLLPTTVMYYIVFTVFRLLSIMLQYSLAKIIYVVQTLPLYIFTLWIARSPKIAGNILIQVKHSAEESHLVLIVKLFNKSLRDLVNKFRPPVEAPKQFELTNILSNVFSGKQII